LYGDNATNPQEPTGLRNTSGITVQTFESPDGGTPADYDFLLDAYFELEAVNFEVSGSILNPRDERTIAGFADTTGQPLRPPDAVTEVPRLRTNQVRVDETTGVNNDTSSVFVGQWPELLIGARTQLQIQLLTERYAESGTLALLAWMRADVAVAREDAFVIIEGLRAAA
jgi:HK97 family phage major capsid protein